MARWAVAIALLAGFGGYSDAEAAVCDSGPRIDCVVDGDTLWIAGEKIRLAGIDAPEIDGQCESERLLSIDARDRLVELIGAFEATDIERLGVDRYGRTLAIVRSAGIDVATQLVGEMLARPWTGRRESWCD